MRAALWMRVCGVMLVVTAACGSTLRAAGAETILDHAPANAEVVIVVPSMKGLSDKLAKLQQALGLPMDEMGDVLGTLKAEAGINAGLKDDGAMMFVLPGLAQAIVAEADEPPMAVLVEVTDFNAFVGNFGGTAGAGVTKLTMPEGTDAFARQVGNFAVFGPDEAVITAFAPAKSGSAMLKNLGTLGSQYLGKGDAFVFVDIAAMGPALRPKVKEGFDEMIAELKASAPADQAAMLEGIFAMYFQAIDAILTDGQAGVFALDMNDDGIGLTKAFQAKAGSTLAGYFPGGSGTGEALLKALPKQPYLMALSMDMKAINLAAIFEKVIAAMPADGDGGWLIKMYKDALPMMKMTKGSSWAWYAPPAEQMMGPGLMNMVTLYDTTDGPGYLAASKAYFEGLNNVAIPMEELGAQPLKFSTTYTPAAMNLEGVSVDQYGMSMALPPELMEQMGPAAGMVMMMGGLNYNGLLAAKDNRVVMSSSLDAAMMSSAILAAGKGDGLGTEANLAAARANAVPPGGAMEMHISLEGILGTANGFMQMFAGQALPVPADLPPISMGMGVKDGGVAGRMYMPMKSLKGIVDTANAAQAAFGGMGGDGMGEEDPQGPPPPF